MTSISAAVKSLLLVACTGLVLGLTTAGPAAAGTPCWRALINDWYDGKIDKTYPRSCYTQAIAHLPQDVKTYSSARDDIQRALLAVIRGGKGGNGSGGQGDSGSKAPESISPDTTASGNTNASGGDTESHNKGVILRAIEWLGPSDAESIPVPLLVLAGVAFLLLATAGGSLVNRRLQERRVPPPPQG
jgi:hypothetical protein